MTDESKLTKDRARGERAKQLLENELLAEAFAEIKAGYLAKWEATTADQEFLREKYWLAHRVVNVVRDHLQAVVADGKLADKQLADLATMAEAVKRRESAS